jgi:UDP-N-acetylglucosamine--N-acetylmuramyl-(pentapeptide) pyrophosphoryl-undecaprenol N-acetylglucosamine transferase
VIAGGGTIGHLTPGLATAEALVARGCPRSALHFVGSARGVEAARLPAAGYPLTLLPGRGLRRRLSIVNLCSNLLALGGLSRALVAAFGLLRRDRPGVVLATGGYASAPCALAAALSGVPLVVAEQNAVLGSANRLALRLGAAGVALSFPETPLPHPLRRRSRRRRVRRGSTNGGLDVEVTGNPVRAEMLAADRAAGGAGARRRLGVPDGRRLLLVYGGSLGAERLNRATVDACRRWAGRGDLAVRHVLGDRDWARARGARAALAGQPLLYQGVRYEDDLPTCLAAADLVVARAGASTVAELTAVGVPSLLVPLPGAPGDHQTANARRLAAAGAAVACADAELDGARLVVLVDELLADAGRLARMSAAAGALGRRDAASAVADLVVAHARRPPPSWETDR